jgi:hypothetical protein
MISSGTLDALTRRLQQTAAVHKDDLDMGDLLVVETRNSCYRILSLGDDSYRVDGGWFDRESGGPVITTIRGCTWGGSAIATDLLAACGLFLEFGNGVVTTAIRAFRVVKPPVSDRVH